MLPDEAWTEGGTPLSQLRRLKGHLGFTPTTSTPEACRTVDLVPVGHGLAVVSPAISVVEPRLQATEHGDDGVHGRRSRGHNLR